MSKCKHCSEEFNISDKPKGWMANHSRWCDKNPKRQMYCNTLVRARENITIESRKSAAHKISERHKQGVYDHVKRDHFKDKNHSDETKQKLRDRALASGHRRLRKNTILYNGILLDSSWELALAKRLDVLNIVWTRPSPVKWIDDSGITHNYFPDFYLPEYDCYLDPKNSFVSKIQEQKLIILKRTYKLIILNSLRECETFSNEYIKNMLG